MSDIRQIVRDFYGRIGAMESSAGGCCGPGDCSPGDTAPSGVETSRKLGYTEADVRGVPEGSNLGLGCGNPQAIASLKPGETVLDLGSGGGFDCFLAARQVGETATVIGVDMTPEMVSRARENVTKGEIKNVEFRLGEIEHLPVADESVDVIISNCVINLSPDKAAVYQEAFRVLKHGGRLAIADVVVTAPLPRDVRDDMELHVACVAGAATTTELQSILAEAGFESIQIQPIEEGRELVREWMPGRGLEDYVVSATIEAMKP